MLSEALGPRDLENEANLGALAELTEGAGRGLRDFVYLSGEIGIGAGHRDRRRPLPGRARVRRRDRAPHHRRLRAARARAARAAASSGSPVRKRSCGWPAGTRACAAPGPRPSGPARCSPSRRAGGHAKTLEALSQVGHTLGIAAAAAVNLLNPEALLLGGYFAPLTEWLREPIEAELHRRLLAGDGSGCAVLAARLGGEAAVRGAVAMSRRQALDDPAALGSESLYAGAIG